MQFAVSQSSPFTPRRLSVTVSLRASGYDDLPDTFYVTFIPAHVEKVGTGARLLLHFGNESHQSMYAITLGPVRVRGDVVVEYLAFGKSFVHGLCYVQIPTHRAKVNKFALIDFIRGRYSRADPIPDRYVRSVRPIALPAAVSSDDLRDSSIEIHVDVEKVRTDEEIKLPNLAMV